MAEDLARRSGLSLNEWVSSLMAEGPEDATSQDYFSQSSANYIEAPRVTAEPRYEAVDHPGAREVLDWLDGHWRYVAEAAPT